MRIHKLGHAFAALLIVTASTAVLSSFSPSLGREQVLAQTVEGRKAEADQLLQQGREQYKTSQFETALKSWQQALIIYREIKDHEDESKVLGNLGLVYHQRGDYPSAINYFQQSLSIARAIKYYLGQAKALGNLGTVFQDMGEYAQAIDYHQQNLALARKIKDPQSEGTALGNLGLTYYSLGDSPTAIQKYREALAIILKIPDRRVEGSLLNNIGIVYFSIGDCLTAIQNYKQALTIVQEIKDHQLEAKILGNLGNAYYLLGEYPKAIDYQLRWLAMAREIGDPQSEGNALGNLGFTYYTIEDYPKAIDYQQKSLGIAEKISDRRGEGQSLHNLGLAFYKSGNLPAAEKSLYKAINIWEALRNSKSKLQDTNKVSLFDTQKNTYTLLQQVLIAQNKNNTALEISERGRARAFVELLASRLSNNNNQAKPPESSTISEMKQIAKTQNSTLVQYSIIMEDLKVAGKPQFRELELYIWVIKSNGEVTFRKTDLKALWQKDNTTLASLVENSRESIGVRSRGIQVTYNPNGGKNPAQGNQKLKKLHQLLISPIEDLLPKNENERIIFIPQASLFLVPFPALQDSNGKYLIEKHTISTAPAIQVLDLTHQRKLKVTGKEVVVMGNPTMPRIGIPPNDYQLDSLGGAENEAKAIAALFKTKPILGNDATKDALLKKLPTAGIIHLATHGLLDDPNKGIPTAIALAPTANDDGLLTLAKILDLKINADLVVLSACDTGQGTLTGDGVIGLSRSLISAGTPSVIVTLWKIPDGATSILMTDFYQNLQQNPDKAVALRKAMLKTMKQYPGPKNWGAFTLVGEAQ